MGDSDLRERRKPEAFRFVLRQATRPEHEALDAHPAFASLMSGTLSRNGYRSLMTQFHDFYCVHDPLLDASCRLHSMERLGFIYAPRSGILGRDLAALEGRAARPASVGPAPPNLETAGSLAGVLYVLEGSMLGGGVLSRAVGALPAVTGETGDGYWRWCRDLGASRWAMTCAMIERLSTSGAARSDMISGARAAFATFAGWLGGWRDDSVQVEPGRLDVERC